PQGLSLPRDYPFGGLSPVMAERVRVELAQVREAPVLFVRVRKRKFPVPLERLGFHGCDPSPYGAYRLCSIRAFPSGSEKNAMWQTPVSSVSPWNSTPAASSCSRAFTTSGTRNAIGQGFDANSSPSASGTMIPSVTLPVSNSRQLWCALGFRPMPCVSPYNCT